MLHEVQKVQWVLHSTWPLIQSCHPVAADKVTAPRHGRSACAELTGSNSCNLYVILCSKSSAVSARSFPRMSPTFFRYQLDSSFRANGWQLAELLHAVQCLSSIACIDFGQVVVRNLQPLSNDRPAWAVRNVSPALELQHIKQPHSLQACSVITHPSM